METEPCENQISKISEYAGYNETSLVDRIHDFECPKWDLMVEQGITRFNYYPLDIKATQVVVR